MWIFSFNYQRTRILSKINFKNKKSKINLKIRRIFGKYREFRNIENIENIE